jgi:chromosome segregation ATPase
MAPPRKPAHTELDRLRQATADERAKHRELEAELARARTAVEQAGAALTDGYVAGDQAAAVAARKRLQKAEAAVDEAQHQIDGSSVRIERKQLEADRYVHDHARDLLDEVEGDARVAAAELTRAAHQVVKLNSAYLATRSRIDQLVSAAGGSPRADGPPVSHVWERELGDLASAVKRTPEVSAPIPRWQGIRHRKAEDTTARRLAEQRARRDRTAV